MFLQPEGWTRSQKIWTEHAHLPQRSHASLEKSFRSWASNTVSTSHGLQPLARFE